jgi:hypothetical protein
MLSEKSKIPERMKPMRPTSRPQRVPHMAIVRDGLVSHVAELVARVVLTLLVSALIVYGVYVMAAFLARLES